MANTDVTLATAVDTLSQQERSAGFTHKWVIDYTDIDEGTGSTDTVTAALGNTPTSFFVTKCIGYITTAFANGGSGTLTVQVGTDGDPNNYMAATALITTGTGTTAGPIGAASGVIPTLAGSAGTSSDVLEALFTNSVGDSPSTLTAGKLVILMQIAEIELP
jgi:hypothetical protein